jgi:DNA-binding HxlR family transcriptional regulator
MNSSDPSASKIPMWDWPSWMKGSVPNPLDVFAAPKNLVQPILPGWVFGAEVNVTEQNSSAPDTEREIVAKQSYGRQLGRIMDALVVLIAEQEKKGPKAAAFDRFMELNREINAIKTQAAASRLDRMIADLAMLKEKEPQQYARVAATLRDVLQQG